MKLSLLDTAVALWVLLAGAAFVLPLVGSSGAWAELVTVARYVYTVVLAVGLAGLALRVIRALRRQSSDE